MPATMTRPQRPKDALLVTPPSASSGLFTGQHDLVKLFPMWGKGDPLYIWAQRGLVHLEDARTDGGYRSIGWQTAAERVLAISEMVINSAECPAWQDERRKLQSFVCAMEECIKKARAQQAPFDDGTALSTLRRIRAKKRVRPVQPPRVVAGDPRYTQTE